MAHDEQANREQMLSALGHVVTASERVIVDRLDLARFDAVEALSHWLREALLLGIGSVLALAGWFGLSAAAVLSFDSQLPLALRLTITAAFNVFVGIALIAFGLCRENRRTRASLSAGEGSPQRDEQR